MIVAPTRRITRRREQRMKNTFLDGLVSDVAQRRIIDAKETAAFLSLPLPSFRRAYRTGNAPKPIQLSDRRLGWQVADVIAWVETRKTEATK
jgi:predicted DNA-binding transcriptional regulator AlpA